MHAFTLHVPFYVIKADQIHAGLWTIHQMWRLQADGHFFFYLMLTDNSIKEQFFSVLSITVCGCFVQQRSVGFCPHLTH